MSEIKARDTIPVSWAEQGHCPVCSASKMQVQHQSAGPDQLRCAACELAFEVESGGVRLHVTHWPDSCAVQRETVAERWLTAAEMRTLIQQSVSLPASPVPAQKTNRLKPDLPDEMVVRARKLKDLGNTPAQIRAILAQTETDPERIQAALVVASQVEHQEQVRQRKKLRLSMGLIGAIVVICMGAGIFLQKMVLSKQTGAASLLQATLVPDLAKILNLNTPVVQYNVAPSGSSSGTSACPRTAVAAAAMFGGQPDKWSSPANSNGWIMIDTSQGNTIYTPMGMTAAYLQLGSNVVLVEVLGPATLSNVYYIAISCP
jgi:DNA-binding transcriptional MerR regulator